MPGRVKNKGMGVMAMPGRQDRELRYFNIYFIYFFNV